jgi:hypothetical protein
MNPEDRNLLESTYKLAEENNDLLRKMYRKQRTGMIIKTLYWVAIIALSLGAYYFIQPYVDLMGNLYNGATGQEKGFDGIKDLLQNLGQ